MKTILIPLAAFAVTVTGASAFNSDMLRKAGLNEEQIAAFEQAKELKESGDKEGARDVLIAAGVDEDVIKQVRDAMREYKDDLHAAIEAEDYEAFEAAIQGSPFAEIIDTEAEFNQLVEAHRLMKEGDRQGAKDIFEDLGLTNPAFMWKLKEDRHNAMPFMSQLSDEEKAELKEAFKDRDEDRIREILEEAGVEWKEGSFPGKRGNGFGQWKEHAHDRN